jgi:hypothetical protein
MLLSENVLKNKYNLEQEAYIGYVSYKEKLPYKQPKHSKQ